MIEMKSLSNETGGGQVVNRTFNHSQLVDAFSGNRSNETRSSRFQPSTLAASSKNEELYEYFMDECEIDEILGDVIGYSRYCRRILGKKPKDDSPNRPLVLIFR